MNEIEQALKECRGFVSCDLAHSNPEIKRYAERVIKQIDTALASLQGNEGALEAFEKYLSKRGLDNAKEGDAWGREKFKHSHIDAMWAAWQAAWSYAALRRGDWMPRAQFKLGDRVRKKGNKGQWQGHIVGFYSTHVTPIGYAVESEREKSSVQIYPESALELIAAGGEDETP